MLHTTCRATKTQLTIPAGKYNINISAHLVVTAHTFDLLFSPIYQRKLIVCILFAQHIRQQPLA